MTIWTEPLEYTGKPLVEFTKWVHTPIIRSQSHDIRYLDIEPLSDTERLEIVTIYIPSFRKALETAKFKKRRRGYDNIIQYGGVPTKYLFNLSKVNGAIVIGSSLPKPEELPGDLSDRIWRD